MNNYEEMLKIPSKRHSYSEIEKQKIVELLGYCHADEIRWTHRGIYELYFKCDAMPGMVITVSDCNDKCARCGCSTYTAADDAECLINQDRTVLEFEVSEGAFFEKEVKAILNKYKHDRTEKLTDTDIHLLAARVKDELQMFGR